MDVVNYPSRIRQDFGMNEPDGWMNEPDSLTNGMFRTQKGPKSLKTRVSGRIGAAWLAGTGPPGAGAGITSVIRTACPLVFSHEQLSIPADG
jgi:hypothetical protein